MRYIFLKNVLSSTLGTYNYELLRHVIAHYRIPKFENPLTFNDRLAHRKLFYTSNSQYIRLAHKLHVRQFVSKRIGVQFLTHLYLDTDNAKVLELKSLPKSFVMKAVHGSGSDFIVFIQDSSKWTDNQLRNEASRLLQQSYGKLTNELWYSQMKPRILVEEMLHDPQLPVPLDYKFFVFNGRVEYIQVDYGRFSNHTRTFYDRDWNPQTFAYKYPKGFISQRPPQLAEMIRIAEQLGSRFNFVRVDLYSIGEHRIVFGEITLTPEAGWGKFQPRRIDYKLGQMWSL